MTLRDSQTPALVKVAVLSLAVCLGQPLVNAASSTLISTQQDADALVRSLEPSDLPDGWELPAHTGHVVDYQVSEWNQYVLQGEEDRAADYGITFSVVDAGLDVSASNAGVDQLVADGTDVLNFTAVDPASSGDHLEAARAAGVAVICATSSVEGCNTVVSADDYGAAFAVGVWAGNYVREHFDGKADVLDVGYPALESTKSRSQGFIDGIISILGAESVSTTSIDGNGLHDVSVTVTTEALLEDAEVNVIFGINDDSAIGALQAYEAAGFNLDDLLVVGFGCDGNDCKDLLREDGPFKVSAATFPEYQGQLLIDAGVAAFNGLELPDQLIAPSVPMTANTVDDYYSLEDDSWTPNFDAISSIPLNP